MSTLFIYAFYKKPLSMKKIIYLLLILAFLSCSKDEPIIESDTTNPNASITNVVVKDIDNDGQVDDAEISVTATDNIAIDYVHVSVGGVSASKVGNIYVVTDLSVGQHTAKIDVTDTSGNTASATRNFTVNMPNVAPTATVTFNDFGEHTPIGTIVGTVEASDINGDTITTTLEEGGSDFELVLQAGQTNKYDIKTKVAFDYEESGDNTHNIKVKVADTALFNEVTSSASETDENDIISQNSLDSPNSMFSSVTIDMADGNSGVQNLVDYEADKDGNSTGRTMAQMIIDINANVYDSNWYYPYAKGNIMQYIKDKDGNTVMTETTNETLIRNAFIDIDGFSQTADVMNSAFHQKALQEGRELLEASGHTTTNIDAWGVSYISGADEDIIFSLYNLTLGNQYARERAAGNMESVNADIVRKSVNIVLSLNVDQRRARYKELVDNGN